MTEREAINEILLSINELPLDTEDLVSDIQTAVVCEKELAIARKKVLARGWVFNTTSISFFPNVLGNISIADTFLSIDVGDNTNYVIRDHKLFDKDELSFTFEENVTLTVIEDIVFDDIPYLIADFIIQTASLQAYIKIVGASDDIRVRQEAVVMSRLEALREDAKNYGGNLLNSGHVTDLVTR